MAGTLQFGDFELDVTAYELRRLGRPVRIERIPMELLILLLERRGDLVSREEIVERLWGKETFVDAETGVNTAIRKVRQALVKESRQALHDKVSRAYGTLKSAQSISSEETMHLLSSVRMGVNLGLIDDLPIPTVNELFMHTQPAHLQKLRKSSLDSADRNTARAAYLRQRLSLPQDGDQN